MLFRRRTPAHEASADLDARVARVQAALDQLGHQVEAIERSEAVRAAQHAAMMDQLGRLYKRVATRIAREQGQQPDQPTEESVMDFRRRLGR